MFGAISVGLALVVATTRVRLRELQAHATDLESQLAHRDAEAPDPEIGVDPIAPVDSSTPEDEGLPAADEGSAMDAGAVLADFAAAARAAAMTDPATGLFNEEFFRVALESRISAARRHLRPVAVALLEVAEGVRAGAPMPVAPTVVAAGLRLTLREADTACRLPDGRFALVLEDTPENGAVWTVERVRRTLAGVNPGQTMWAGVACYPAHAFDATEVLDRAALALEAAKEWHQDRIEVATSEM